MVALHSLSGAPSLFSPPADERGALQLLKELEDPSFLTVVHLDENSSPDYKDVVGSIVKPFARASLARSPVPCSWGGEQL